MAWANNAGNMWTTTSGSSFIRPMWKANNPPLPEKPAALMVLVTASYSLNVVSVGSAG